MPGEDCTAAGSSISGLSFYQGGNYPAAYSGALFFADYSRRCTWVMFEKNGQPDPTTVTSFLNENDPVNLEIGPGGDLYVVDFTGSVRRISYPGGNRAPTAVAVAQPKAGAVPLTVNFDGTGSTDPDAGDTLTYAWDLDGDGQYDDSTAAKPTWTYTSAGSVTVRLRVTDKGGQSATDSIVVGPGNDAPHAQIDTPTAALHWAVGDPISFSGQGSDPQDGTLSPARMSWAVVMRHCHTANDCHSHPIQSYPGVTGGSFIAPDHEYPTNYYSYRLEAGGEVKGVPEGFLSDAPWSWEDAEDTKALPNGVWSHIAMTYDGTNMRLYVNGVLVSTRAAPKPHVDGGELTIGGNYFENFYEGLIDEVRIYNRAPSAAEIGTDMNTAVNP